MDRHERVAERAHRDLCPATQHAHVAGAVADRDEIAARRERRDRQRRRASRHRGCARGHARTAGSAPPVKSVFLPSASEVEGRRPCSVSNVPPASPGRDAKAWIHPVSVPATHRFRVGAERRDLVARANAANGLLAS